MFCCCAISCSHHIFMTRLLSPGSRGDGVTASRQGCQAKITFGDCIFTFVNMIPLDIFKGLQGVWYVCMYKCSVPVYMCKCSMYACVSEVYSYGLNSFPKGCSGLPYKRNNGCVQNHSLSLYNAPHREYAIL